MILETKNLILRQWAESDAGAMFRLESEPEVGYWCGWSPPKSEVECIATIKQWQAQWKSKRRFFAVTLRSSGELVGLAGLNLGYDSCKDLCAGNAELVYWIGKPYWGRGYATESARALVHYGLIDLALNELWVGYYDGNERSKNVIEKCGFIFRYSNPDVETLIPGDLRLTHVYSLPRSLYVVRSDI